MSSRRGLLVFKVARVPFTVETRAEAERYARGILQMHQHPNVLIDRSKLAPITQAQVDALIAEVPSSKDAK